MAEKPKLTIKVIDPDKIVFEGMAEYVLAPGVRGTVGILPGHVPMFAELKKGEVYIKGEKEDLIPLESGIIKVSADIVTVLIGS